MWKLFEIAKITRRNHGKKRKSNALTKAMAKQSAIEDMKKDKEFLNFLNN